MTDQRFAPRLRHLQFSPSKVDHEGAAGGGGLGLSIAQIGAITRRGKSANFGGAVNAEQKCVVCGEDRPYLLDPHHINGVLAPTTEWVCKAHDALRHLEWSARRARRTSGGNRVRMKDGEYCWKYNPNVLTPHDLIPYFDQRKEGQITEALRLTATAALRQRLTELAKSAAIESVPYLPCGVGPG